MQLQGFPIRWGALGGAAFANIYLLITEPGVMKSEFGSRPKSNHDWLEPIWPFLAIPLLLLIQRFAQNTLTASESLGKYYIFIWRIFDQAVLPFLVIFGIYLVNYGIALFLTAPRFVFGERHGLAQRTRAPLHLCARFSLAAVSLHICARFVHASHTLLTSVCALCGAAGEGRSDPSNGVWELTAMLEDVLLLGLVGKEMPIDFAHELDECVQRISSTPAPLAAPPASLAHSIICL